MKEKEHPCQKKSHHGTDSDPEKKMTQKDYMSGKMIEPLELDGNEDIKNFVDNIFGDSGYNGRKLAQACECAKRMLKDKDTVVCLTLAGAMTPIGMSGPIIKMMESGFIDFIISTGANLYHDLHRAYNHPMVQGDEFVNDSDLNDNGVARIYDVFIEDSETLLATDMHLANLAESEFKEPISTSELHKFLGEMVLKTAKNPEKSLLAQAAKHNVPIYTSSPGDSSIGMNFALTWLFGHRVMIDSIKDVIETTAIVRAAKKNGVIIVGGGSPKNFYMQTQPMLWQMLRDESKGGHDYFIQLTTDSPQWGGLSGATPQEAISWGKVKEAGKNTVVVYSCASITLPILFQYMKMAVRPREKKGLYGVKDSLVKELMESAYANKELKEDIVASTSPENYRRVYEKMLGPMNK